MLQCYLMLEQIGKNSKSEWDITTISTTMDTYAELAPQTKVRSCGDLSEKICLFNAITTLPFTLPLLCSYLETLMYQLFLTVKIEII